MSDSTSIISTTFLYRRRPTRIFCCCELPQISPIKLWHVWVQVGHYQGVTWINKEALKVYYSMPLQTISFATVKVV